MKRLSPALLAAYRRTVYRVCGIEVRIERSSRPLDRLLARAGGRTAVFVTAWNPFSRKMPPGWNHRMQHALQERLRRRTCFAAEGVGRGWREAHLLVVAEPAFVCRLSRIYRQNAVVVLHKRQSARLM